MVDGLAPAGSDAESRTDTAVELPLAVEKDAPLPLAAVLGELEGLPVPKS